MNTLKTWLQNYEWQVAKPKIADGGKQFIATGGLAVWLAPHIEPYLSHFTHVTWPYVQMILGVIGIHLTVTIVVDKVIFYGFLATMFHLAVVGGHDAIGLAMQNLKEGKLPTEEPK